MASLSGALSFLSNGQAPINTMTGSQTSSILPSWYQDYTSQMLNKAAQYANEPAPISPAPQVAALTGAQQQSYNQIGDIASTYGGVPQQAMGMVAGANPQGGLNAANPYLSQSDQTSASQVGNYMNPYTQNVVNDIATLGTRNLTENTLPALQSAFTSSGGGGHYGGDNVGGGNTQEGTLEERLGRDTGNSILQQQNQALQSGYGQSLAAAGTDLARQGALAGTAGNLGQQGTAAQMQQGMYTGALGQQGQGMDIQSAQALNAAGQQQQQQAQANLNAANQQFWQQQQWPLQGIQAMQGALQGVTIPTTSNVQNFGPAATYAPSPLASLGNLATATNAATMPQQPSILAMMGLPVSGTTQG
jgi:hypothetical protein